jgi:uncharacterized protein
MATESQTERSSEAGESAAATGRQSLGVKAALEALRSYKLYVSPWFAGSCRFEPTCSAYAYQAIARFGVKRGMWMGLKRLLRCHPLSRKFGFDPVPEPLQAATQHDVHAGRETGAADLASKGAHS